MSANLVDALKSIRQRFEAGESIPYGQVPEAISDCAFIDANLKKMLFSHPQPKPDSAIKHDRLLSIDEAAYKLGCSKDRLYRHPPEFRNFEVRNGRQLRFSERGIEEFIARSKMKI